MVPSSDDEDEHDERYHTAKANDAPATPDKAQADSAPQTPDASDLASISLEGPLSPSASADTVPLNTLTEHDVVALLTSLGLQRYADVCLALPLRGADLVYCSDSDLKSAGIAFQPHRLSMLEMITRFNSDGVPAALLKGDAPAASPSKDAALDAALDDGASITSDNSMPAWLSQAQAQLGTTEVLLHREADPEAATEGESSPPPQTTPQLEQHGDDDDDNLGPLPPLGARALLAAERLQQQQQQQPPSVQAERGFDPFPARPAAEGGTVVLSRLPPPPSAGQGASSDDSGSATLEIHFAEDRGSIRVISGRSVGPFGVRTCEWRSSRECATALLSHRTALEASLHHVRRRRTSSAAATPVSTSRCMPRTSRPSRRPSSLRGPS